MQIQIEDVSPVEKKLIIEVPWDTVEGKLGKAYRDLSRTVKLRGFRQGKVPQRVLEQMFGKRVRAEVVKDLVQEGFATAIEKHSVEAVSQPRVDTEPQIRKGQPLAFEVMVEVRGEIGAIDHEGMELRCHKVEVTDEQLDAAIEALRREHTELLPIEGRDVTARTDVLTIDLSGSIGEMELDREGVNVDLGDPDREPLPGLIAALTGLPIDDQTHTLELPIPEDFPERAVAGATARLEVTIQDARQKRLPELDDEFAVDTGRAQTLDELRQKLREDLERRQAAGRKRELRDAAKRALVAKNEIPVAPSLVDRAAAMQARRIEQMLGLPPGSGDSLEMRDGMRKMALDELRSELLLAALADQHEIEVSEEALSEHIGELAEREGTPARRLRAELERDGNIDTLRYQLRNELALDWLVERATVVEHDHTADAPDHDHGDHDHDHDHGDHGHGDHDHGETPDAAGAGEAAGASAAPAAEGDPDASARPAADSPEAASEPAETTEG